MNEVRPMKLEVRPTMAENDLLEEVEAMGRIIAHKPARQTPLMSSPMKQTTLFCNPDQYSPIPRFRSDPRSHPRPILQASQVPSRTSPRTAPTPIPSFSTYLGLTLSSSHTVSRTHAYNSTREPPRPVPTCPSHCQHQERYLEERKWSLQSDRGNLQGSHCKGLRREEAESPER